MTRAARLLGALGLLAVLAGCGAAEPEPERAAPPRVHPR